MQYMTKLSGLTPQTTRAYVNNIRAIMVDESKRMYRDWVGDLGGPGKVIEIDEVFVVKRKYNVGKRLAKEELVVFGITERDGGPVQILDDEFYAYLVDKEDDGKRKAQRRNGRRKMRQRGSAGVSRSRPVEREVEPRANHIVGRGLPGTATADQVPFSHDPDMERIEKQLFGQRVKTRPRRTLFFMVPNRARETLVDIIYKYVKKDCHFLRLLEKLR